MLVFQNDGSAWYNGHVEDDLWTCALVEYEGPLTSRQARDTLTEWWRVECGYDYQSTALPFPPGFRWRGHYYPVVWYNGYPRIVAHTTFSSPYDAREFAKEILVTSGLAVQDYSWERVALCRVGQMHLPTCYTSLLPEVPGEPLQLVTTTTKSITVGRGCSNCGLVGHNSRTCATTRYYDKVGIEIEGRYTNLNSICAEARNDGLTYTEDGSISRTSTAAPMEFQTKPGLLCEALRQLEKFYPDEADYSCGLHVHVSFRDVTHITQLMCRAFFDYFKSRWLQFATENNLHEQSQFMQRLRGENDYCYPNNEDTDDYSYRPFEGDRYKQLNFRAWNEHKTVECRLLPMFRNSEMAVKAVTFLLTIYQDWLSDNNLGVEVVSDFDTAHRSEVMAGEVDFPEQFSDATEQWVDIPDLPPVAEGHQRIAIPETYLHALRTMRLVA